MKALINPRWPLDPILSLDIIENQMQNLRQIAKVELPHEESLIVCAFANIRKALQNTESQK